MAKVQNFWPSELKAPKKRSNNVAVFTRLACIDVRTWGFERRIALLNVFILKYVCFGAELCL